MNEQLDRIEQMLNALCANNVVQQNDEVMMKSDVKHLVIKMFAEMNGRNKINAIRYYRQLTGLGIKEAKDAIEVFYYRNTK